MDIKKPLEFGEEHGLGDLPINITGESPPPVKGSSDYGDIPPDIQQNGRVKQGFSEFKEGTPDFSQLRTRSSYNALPLNAIKIQETQEGAVPSGTDPVEIFRYNVPRGYVFIPRLFVYQSFVVTTAAIPQGIFVSGAGAIDGTIITFESGGASLPGLNNIEGDSYGSIPVYAVIPGDTVFSVKYTRPAGAGASTYGILSRVEGELLPKSETYYQAIPIKG